MADEAVVPVAKVYDEMGGYIDGQIATGVAKQDLGAHYALLLRDSLVVGIVCLNMEDEVNCEVDGDYLPAYIFDVRYLLTNLLETGATSVVVLSTRTHLTSNMFDSDDLEFVEQLATTLNLLNVTLLDWVVLTDTENASWRWQCLAIIALRMGM